MKTWFSSEKRVVYCPWWILVCACILVWWWCGIVASTCMHHHICIILCVSLRMHYHVCVIICASSCMHHHVCMAVSVYHDSHYSGLKKNSVAFCGCEETHSTTCVCAVCGWLMWRGVVQPLLHMHVYNCCLPVCVVLFVLCCCDVLLYVLSCAVLWCPALCVVCSAEILYEIFSHVFACHHS